MQLQEDNARSIAAPCKESAVLATNGSTTHILQPRGRSQDDVTVTVLGKDSYGSQFGEVSLQASAAQHDICS